MENEHAFEIFTQNGPKISVIVTIFNTEKYLERCIDSIISQYYQNIEIVLVDDGSVDSCPQIISAYSKQDQRIKVICHQQNLGLFQARITGVLHATGEYIAFVDSDDYLSADWLIKLVYQAQKANSDITVGEWCFDFDGIRKEYCNLDHFRLNDYNLESEQIMDSFMEVQGRNYSWTVIWNKLYSKSLWQQCLPSFTEFSRSHGHMLMWEDIAFSSALWAYAKRVSNVHGSCYFYYKHSDASTSIEYNKQKNLKYISDASAAMFFMKSVLLQKGIYEKYQNDFEQWKNRGMSIVYKDLVVSLKKKEFINDVLTAFQCAFENYTEPDDFLFLTTTPLDKSFDHLKQIKDKIRSESTQFVNFDIFEVLIQRPFASPTDLFVLLSERINKSFTTYIDFRQIRINAQKMISERQTVTLDAIYQYIKENYVFDAGLIDEIKNYEIALEKQFCTTRKLGKELYEFALFCKKRITLCADTSLPKHVIISILEKNGFTKFENVYICSEIGTTKSSKLFYKSIQKDLACKDARAMLHIGNNIDSGINNAAACGWQTGLIFKSIDMLFNSSPDFYRGEAFNRLYQKAFFKEDLQLAYNDFTSVRSMLALVANRFFDNPFISFHPDSDFNADPRFIGYGPLGMHLFSLCHWIHQNVKSQNIGTVHFVARDGYIVKQAYDCLFGTDCQTNYLRVSRKSLILADVNRIEDLYSVFNKIPTTISPKEYIKYFRALIPDEKCNDLPKLFQENGLSFEHRLKNHEESARCLKLLIDHAIDLSLLPAYRANLKEYFSNIIKPEDYIFDIGYSGRVESALSNILGFSVGSMYLHVNSEVASFRQQKNSSPCLTFFDYKPCITGVMREHLLMELGPSTIGYKKTDGNMCPVFENHNSEYWSDMITHIIQEYALKFVKDYTALFGEYQSMHTFQNAVLCAPLEYYLCYSKSVDRKIFATLVFEDDLGEGGKFSAVDFWNREIASRNFSIGTSRVIDMNTSQTMLLFEICIKLYRLLNKTFPKGSKSRKIINQIIKLRNKTN